MRKIKLLMAICALLVGGSNLAVNAQASYNTSWTDGVEITEGYDYFLYNIGSGTFLTGGMDWGSSASGDHAGKTVQFYTVSDGVYKIWSYYYSANGLSNDGWLGTNSYLDGGEEGLAECVFTPVTVNGYTNAYTIKNTKSDKENTAGKFLRYNAADTRVRWSDDGADNYAYWLIIPKANRDAIGDYTYYIQNAGMNRFWERACWAGSTWDNTGFTTGGRAANPCGEKYHGAFDFNQVLSRNGLLAGRYRLYAQAFWRQDGSDAGPVLYLGDATQTLALFNGNGEGTAASMDGASDAFTAGQYINSVEKFFSSAPEANSVRLGINITSGSQWVIWDNFYLQYLGQCVMDYAVALPNDGAMEANTWYYFDIAAAADNYTATATTLGDIICTTDGYTLTSAGSGNVTLKAEDNSLTAQRYYVKSSSANNLDVEVPSFSYNVSAATADKTYIQPGQTVTVSYTVSTNDPDATLSKDFSGVTFNGESISVNQTESGFTFTVPTVTAATNYTLAIPAGAIGYAAGSAYNAEQSITLKTPAVFDGTYFFKVENEGALKGQYLSRGKDWGTHASIDKYGLAIKVATDADNKTTLKPFDTNRFYRMVATYDCWADQTTNDDYAKFNLVANNGHISIHPYSNTDTEDYFKYDNADVAETTKIWADSHSGGNGGNILEFSLETGAEHATAMQALKDNQAATAAAAAYASGNYASLNGITTVAALEAELTANYIQGDFVSPSAIETISEKYQGNQPGQSNTVDTVYSNTIHISKAGFYKFSMQAFYRAGGNPVTQEMHTAGVDFPPVVLFFGDSETQIKSIYDEGGLDQGIAEGYYETETVGGAPVQYNGKWYTNGQHNSVIIFQKDYYHNDVWFYASEPGDYSYGVKYLGFANANAQWFIYSPESVTITSYAAAATTADYEALADAITAYDNATWGFEDGEYAPYNNVSALTNIEAAKAIDSKETNSKLLVNSLTESISLVANDGEVNAIYNGNFSNGIGSPAADIQTYGWTRTNGWGQFQSGISGKYTTAYYNQPGSMQYGNAGVYSMPLKANTVYKLTFAYRSHEEDSNTDMKVSVLNEEEDGLAEITLDGNSSATDWAEKTVFFETGAAGNYVLTLGSGGNTWITGASLYKFTSVYAVVGNNNTIFSSSWDQATQTDILTVNNGVFTKTYSNQELDKQTIEYKFIKKGSVEATEATEWYSNKGNDNSTVSIPVKGRYNITFTFDGSVVAGVATKTAEAVTIGESGWATTVTNSALDFSGVPVEAYTATVDVENNKVVLEEVDDVQAETGLVLQGTEGRTYYVPVAESSTTEKGSLLFSSIYSYDITDDELVSYTFYGLTINNEDEAQFVKLKKGTIPAQKAFLKVKGTNAARTLTVVFEDETVTGINTVRVENSMDSIYNLNGQRVNAPVKGLYIVNGKKVVKK